ncbi:MAG: hypothetical protein ACLPX5_14515 [Dissulfurispiraceae bacterium]
MSENHIRGISTTLSLLDKALCEFDQWAHGHEVRSILYEVQNPLSPGQGRAISELVSEMQSILKKISDRLTLETTVRRVDKMMLGSCSVLWVSLAELDGGHLRRYGELPPGLAEYLDPKAALLTEKLGGIADIVATGVR